MRGWGVAPRDIDLAAWRAKEQLKSPLFLAKGHEDKANSDERRADIALIAKALTPNGNACLVVGRRGVPRNEKGRFLPTRPLARPTSSP
jgi:hypothetical protein